MRVWMQIWLAVIALIKKMEHLLHNVSTQEQIMLLGHGSDKGLFYREDDTKDEFDTTLLDTHTVSICASMVVIWLVYGVMATQQEILKSNTIMFGHLRWLLDEDIPLCEIPQRIKNMDAERTSLSVFNYTTTETTMTTWRTGATVSVTKLHTTWTTRLLLSTRFFRKLKETSRQLGDCSQVINLSIPEQS